MARVGVLAAGVMLMTGLASADGEPLHLMTYSTGKGAQAASLAQCVDAALSREIERLFSCVEVSSAPAIAQRLNGPARQKLLGGDVTDREWPVLVRPAGVRYVVSTRVTMGANSLQVAGNLVRASDGKTITGRISHLEKDAGASGECEQFAEEFANQLSNVPAFSSDSCPPPSEWTGTVTIEESADEIHEKSWQGANEGVGKSIEETRSKRRALIRILHSGATARDSAVGLIRTEEDYAGRHQCGTTANPRWEKWSSTKVDMVASVADGTVPAQVEVSVGEGKIHLSLHIEPVPKKTTITKKIVYEGGTQVSCTAPDPVDQKEEAVADGAPYNFSFDAPVGRDPNRQSGVWTAPKNELVPTAKTTISWNLTRAKPGK